MTVDRQGHALSGADAAAAAGYDRAVEQFGLYRGDPLGELDRTLAAAPQCVMALAARAWMLALATEPGATAEARRALAAARALPADEREASHLVALALLVDGRWDEAALALDRHNVRWPRDVLGLQAGHLADFFRGNARSLRDRIARALPHWSADQPGRPLVLGMYAFGLEETGDYARAEDMGREAVDLEPRDCWAHHAVAHVMEMQGRAEDGLGWMTAREPFWSGDDNFFKIHNHWHRALYHLELGQAREVLALYDGPIRGSRSAVVVDLVDAAALLWRLQLAGHEVGDRWDELASAWEPHADGRSYPFNDWHAVMAYLGAGRDGEVDRLERSLSEAAAGDTPVAGWIRATGLPLVHGFVAFWRGDYRAATEHLHPARFVANRFGGSHAQRDVIDWTLTEAALRGGPGDLAESLAHERLALKPHSPVNRGFLRRAREAAAPVGSPPPSAVPR
jgi:tetratricopeptide (TPR) repeat protein